MEFISYCHLNGTSDDQRKIEKHCWYAPKIRGIRQNILISVKQGKKMIKLEFIRVKNAFVSNSSII